MGTQVVALPGEEHSHLDVSSKVAPGVGRDNPVPRDAEEDDGEAVRPRGRGELSHSDDP